MRECFIRGNTIKYLRIPDEVLEKVKEDVSSLSMQFHAEIEYHIISSITEFIMLLSLLSVSHNIFLMYSAEGQEHWFRWSRWSRWSRRSWWRYHLYLFFFYCKFPLSYPLPCVHTAPIISNIECIHGALRLL
jgi:hypothetical protein